MSSIPALVSSIVWGTIGLYVAISALVSSIVWGTIGLYVAIYELIDFFVYVWTYPDLMDMNALFFLIGLTLVGSAILQWNNRKTVKITTNIYLILISLGMIPISILGAASAHTSMSLFEKVFPWVGVALSFLCILCALIGKPQKQQAPE